MVTCAWVPQEREPDLRVEPEQARKLVVLNRWRRLCRTDAEAEKAGVRCSFVDLDGTSWSDRSGAMSVPRPT